MSLNNIQCLYLVESEVVYHKLNSIASSSSSQIPMLFQSLKILFLQPRLFITSSNSSLNSPRVYNSNIKTLFMDL